MLGHVMATGCFRARPFEAPLRLMLAQAFGTIARIRRLEGGLIGWHDRIWGVERVNHRLVGGMKFPSHEFSQPSVIESGDSRARCLPLAYRMVSRRAGGRSEARGAARWTYSDTARGVLEQAASSTRTGRCPAC